MPPTYLCSSVNPSVDFYYCPGANPEFQRIPDKKPLDPKIIPSIRIELFKALMNQAGQNPPYLTNVSVYELEEFGKLTELGILGKLGNSDDNA